MQVPCDLAASAARVRLSMRSSDSLTAPRRGLVRIQQDDEVLCLILDQQSPFRERHVAREADDLSDAIPPLCRTDLLSTAERLKWRCGQRIECCEYRTSSAIRARLSAVTLSTT
jgi:hypothetical protein